MGKSKKPMPIRLTNRTAIGLRKTAQRVRGTWLIAMGVFSMVAIVLALYLGFSWLPAVPLTLLFSGIVLALMMIASRSQYLMLISQAICTEAASRQMEERAGEQKRRRKAIEELAAMRADLREAEKRGVARDGRRGEESLLFDLLTGREPSEAEILRQRRSEEDDELYAASYREETDEEADDDLYPVRIEKKAKKPAAAATMQTGSTRIITKQEAPAMTAATAPVARVEAEAEGGVRRRRRSVSAQTAPLQLIRNDQAK